MLSSNSALSTGGLPPSPPATFIGKCHFQAGAMEAFTGEAQRPARGTFRQVASPTDLQSRPVYRRPSSQEQTVDLVTTGPKRRPTRNALTPSEPSLHMPVAFPSSNRLPAYVNDNDPSMCPRLVTPPRRTRQLKTPTGPMPATFAPNTFAFIRPSRSTYSFDASQSHILTW